MWDIIVQVIITVCSCGSIFLLSGKKYVKWGFVVGLLGQPFWVWTSWDNAQWGIFLVSLWFTFSHGRGIYNHWKTKEEPAPPIVQLTGGRMVDPQLPGDFHFLKVGDLIIDRGWPHVIIDAGPEQGKRLAAFRSPYGWRVITK